MAVMTAADMVALARKNAPGPNNDLTVKFSTQQRQMRRQAQKKGQGSSPKPDSAPKVKPEPMDVDQVPAGPVPGTYTDYTIYSKVLDAETYCLIRFKAPNPNDPVDITRMPSPYRLNRKNPKAKSKDDALADSLAPKEPKWHPLRGPDGREIVGKDGKVVMGAMVDGKEILQVNWGKEKEKMTKAELDAKKKKASFKKKTRQVFSANPESRNDPQERFPWVFESAGDRDSWTGRKQNFDDGSAYGILTAVPGRSDAMQFVPVPLRYDFVMTKTHAASKSAEAAEAELADIMKRGSLLYQLNRRANGSASAAALATITGEGTSSPTGSRVKKEEEDESAGLFGSDDEGARKPRQGDGEGVDEMDYEEEHADDEDNVEPEELEDEDTKASKARIKREQIAANKTTDGGVIDDDEDEDETLTREGRRMKRALQKQGLGYGSDEEESQNPYASEEEDEDDDGFLFRPPAPETPNVKPATPPPNSNTSGSRSSTPKLHSVSKTSNSVNASTTKEKPVSASVTLKVPPSVGSRASSPVPGVSGSAVVAQRATSPAPKKGSRSSTPSGNHSQRSSSPLAGGAGSRAGSPLPAVPSPLGGSRPAPAPRPSAPAATPAMKGRPRAQSPQTSTPGPSGAAGSPLKRKAMDEGSSPTLSTNIGGGQPATGSPTKEPIKKKIKKTGGKPPAGSPAPSPTPHIETFPGMIVESEVIDVLRQHSEGIVSTALIALFRKRFDEPRNKKVLSSIVKRVANSAPVPGGNSYLLTMKSDI